MYNGTHPVGRRSNAKAGVPGRIGDFHRRGGRFPRRRLDEVPRPARVLPDGPPGGRRRTLRKNGRDPAAGAVEQPVRPRGWDENGVPAPRREREIRFPGAAHGVRPRGDHRVLHTVRPPGDPVGGRDEVPESVPGEGRGGARGATFLRRAGQGVDHTREGAGEAGPAAGGNESASDVGGPAPPSLPSVPRPSVRRPSAPLPSPPLPSAPLPPSAGTPSPRRRRRSPPALPPGGRRRRA